MIVNNLTNSTPISTKGLTTQHEASVIFRADDDLNTPPFATFNINDYDCCFKELAVADLIDDVSWKNDKTSFLFDISIPSDTVIIKMYKNDVEVATLNNNTYGTFYDSSAFPKQDKVGFVLDWRLVLADVGNSLGAGCYQFKADRVIINRNSVVSTHHYELKPYNEFITNETIRFNVFSSGYIEGGIDYLGFEWENMIRLRGKFWNPQATFETDNYKDTKRSINQIQDEITTDYTLELEPIPVSIAKPLIYDRLLGNKILITDYNLFNFERYLEKEVYPVEILDSVFHNRTGNGKFNIKFTDKLQNIIKRNYI